MLSAWHSSSPARRHATLRSPCRAVRRAVHATGRDSQKKSQGRRPWLLSSPSLRGLCRHGLLDYGRWGRCCGLHRILVGFRGSCSIPGFLFDSGILTSIPGFLLIRGLLPDSRSRGRRSTCCGQLAGSSAYAHAARSGLAAAAARESESTLAQMPASTEFDFAARKDRDFPPVLRGLGGGPAG